MRRKAGHRLNVQAKAVRADRVQQIGWRYIPAVLGYCGFCALFIAYFARTSSPELAWFFAGFGGGASLLLLWIAADSQHANWLESAAVSEENTSQVVRKLRRLGWRVIDNIPFEDYDVDHVAFGPGGIILLETKWTSQRYVAKDGRPTNYGANALRQANRNIPKINAVLHMNGYAGTVAQAIVVVWGTRIPSRTAASTTGAAVLLNGDELGDYLSELGPVLTADEITDAYNAVNEFVEKRLAYDKAKAEVVQVGADGRNGRR